MAPMDNEEFERLLAELSRLCDEAMAEEARRIFERMDEAPPIEVGDQGVVLLGFEGNVDAVWSVAKRPDTLLRPLLQRPTVAEWDEDPTRVSMPVATYRRVGEYVYQRES